MSGGAAIPLPTTRAGPSPTRARHHVSRSITERLPRTTSSSSTKHGQTPATHSSHHNNHHHHHHITGHISSSLHRRDRSRDARHGNMAVPQSAVPQLQNVASRGSLEVPRSDGVTSGAPSPDQSRRGSTLLSGVVEGAGPAGTPLSIEELLRRERVKAEARTVGLRNSLVDLTAFSTTTTRRLDEAYYTVLQKLTALQNTIVALKDLAEASSATSAGFIAESHSVLAEAQSQLDAFGDFSEQQERVQALQDRVHGARERIEALSGRVDVVKRRVERWERAWAQSWENARRGMRIVWGVLLGLGLVMLVLYLGARAYAPEIEGAVEELRGDAVAAQMKLEHNSLGVVGGQGRAEDGQGEREDGENENRSLPLLSFNRDREASLAGDEALRALDEL